ncbi:MAG: succinate dehydrogenase, hydrophobic membrane anchor protein [Betaproteobacteria bacterium]|nr:succinate dehydrogenase, hydrophobic membrane anchor protein [Betaproteobacteria bacterium]
MVKRVVVGAHYGLKDWLVQRVTALLMALYTLFMMVAAPLAAAGGYEGWRGLMSHGVVQFATFLFIVSLAYHAWIGVRDIWMDYVKPVGVRLALHVATLVVLVGCAGWAVQILWRL